MRTSTRIVSAAALLAALAGSTAAQRAINAAPAINPGPIGQDGAPGVADAPAKPDALVRPWSVRLGIPLGPEVPVLAAQPVDMARVAAQDAVSTTKAFRVGVPADLVVTPAMGAWYDLGAQGRLWVCDVRSAGAQGLRVRLAGMDLPRGAEAIVYSPDDPGFVCGPYTQAGPFGTGEVWAPMTAGQTARVEILFPAGVEPGNSWRIDTVQHIYRDPLVGGGVNPAEGNCHRDVTCFSAWANIALAVARIQYVQGGTFICTGQLVNNLTSDLAPYFYTANHCIDTAGGANSCVFYWRFQTSTCNGTPPTLASVPQSSFASLVTTLTTADTTLMLIQGTIPRTLFWTGWDTADVAAGTAVTGVHHPDGAYKRISFGNKANNPTCFGSYPSWIRSNWSTTIRAVTEPGSSGSGLYSDANQRLIALLSCGPSACGVTDANLHDTYGRFGAAYAASASIQNVQTNGFGDDSSAPNQTCATARAIGAGSLLSRVVKLNRDDWYSMSVPPGQQVNIGLSFTHTNGDVDTRLFDGCGGTTLDTSTGTGNSETLNWQNLSQTARTVQQQVYLFNDTLNTYNLTVSFTSPAPANDLCANARAVGTGAHAFNNWNANTDGPSEPNRCNFSSDPQIGGDVWFRYTAPATGAVTASTCGSEYDTDMAVYGSTCPTTSNTVITCNDDAGGTCGPGGLGSRATFFAIAGRQYLIRVGGFTNASNVIRRGQGTLTIGAPCTADFNADGVADINDFFAYLTAYANGLPAANINGDGVLDINDFFAYLTFYANGC